MIAYNEQVAARADGGLLVVTVRDDAGVVVGGLWGRVSRGFVFVAFLAEPVLAEARERLVMEASWIRFRDYGWGLKPAGLPCTIKPGRLSRGSMFDEPKMK